MGLRLAGAQKGIHEGTRSSLFFEFIRIVKEMRNATNGRYPRFLVWENVPGARSSNKGEDFRAVLQSFCEIKDPEIHVPRPVGNGWGPAGVIVGDAFSIAWRTLDAQFWGVPQRRKRIYLICDFGGERAGSLLFEPESLSGDSEPGLQAWEDLTRASHGGALGSCGATDSRAITNAVDCRNLTLNEEMSATLQSKPGGGHSLNFINPVFRENVRYGG